MNLDLKSEPSNILVIDDDEAVCFTYDLVLSDAGYKVFRAKDGKEALEILGKEDITVVIIDLNLPDISGVELCNQIRCFQQNSYIIAITGYTKHFDIKTCYQVGFDDFLEKPVSLELLRTSASEAFEHIKNIEYY